MTRTIAIGDIHGCLAEFDEMLKLTGYKQGSDRLVLLGDLIDRGPSPDGVVRRAREVGADCVMGNHEEKALRWRKHEKNRAANPDKYKNPMRSIHVDRLAQWAKISDDDWDWVASLPCYIHIDEHWTAVHAGVLPDCEVEDQHNNDLMRVRYVKTVPHPSGYSKYKMVSPDERGEMPPGTRHWTDLWGGPRRIVYGHYTYQEGFCATELTLGIDTGCVHGDLLTACIFEGFQRQIVTVKAFETYSPRKPWNDSEE